MYISPVSLSVVDIIWYVKMEHFELSFIEKVHFIRRNKGKKTKLVLSIDWNVSFSKRNKYPTYSKSSCQYHIRSFCKLII